MLTARSDLLRRLAVVIVTYRSARDIESCLQTLPLEELGALVVVDNDSPDDTVEVIRRLDVSGLDLVQRPNTGFGSGLNAGVAAVSAEVEFVLLLNPDARIGVGDLVTLVTELDHRKQCGLIAPVLTRDGVRQFSAGRLPTLVSELKPLLPRLIAGRLRLRRIDPTRLVDGPVGYVEGACMLVREEAFRAVDGFDETYFLCFEEMDLAHRLEDAGWSVELCTAAQAEHAGGASRSQMPQHGVEHFVRSRVYYLRTWRGAWAASAYTVAARAVWWLRRLLGRLEPEAHEAMVLGLRTPLRTRTR